MGFSLDLSKFAKLTEKKLEKTVIGASIDMFSGVIEDSAVDSGRMRNSWFVDFDGFANGVSDSTSKGDKVIKDMKRKVKKFKIGQTITFTNNMDYAIVNEYGLHQPKESDGVSGGFSKKSPQGMVGINVMRVQKWIDLEARKVN